MFEFQDTHSRFVSNVGTKQLIGCKLVMGTVDSNYLLCMLSKYKAQISVCDRVIVASQDVLCFFLLYTLFIVLVFTVQCSWFCRKLDIVDHVLQKLEKYANNLESIVEQRTADLLDEKRKTDLLLNQMLPPSAHFLLLNNVLIMITDPRIGLL